MRWYTFILFALLALVLQSSVAPRLDVFGLRADWVIVIVVFFALHARSFDAVVCAWGFGAMADLMTIERMGLLSMSCALAALLVVSIREYVFKDRILTQVAVVFVTSVFVRLLWCFYRHLMYAQLDETLAQTAADVFGGAIYTAAWAPLVHALLGRMSSLFGLPRPRYTYAGLHRTEAGRV